MHGLMNISCTRFTVDCNSRDPGPRLNIRKDVSSAADVPVKFQSDRTILNTNLAVSRLYEILRKDVFSDIETGP